jgi:large subunit ribosomal protein L5
VSDAKEKKKQETKATPEAAKGEKKEHPKAKAKDQKAEGKGAKPKDAKEHKEEQKREKKPKVPSELWIRYQKECIPALIQKFSYKNRMQVPRLSKIVVNTSTKDALQDAKVLQTAADELALITGQKAVITKAKKSIANFKLRQGQSIGAMVTLRGKAMYDFMNKLVNVVLPRVRDFKGVSPRAFDGRGNYTLGLTEQTIFPEINFDKVQKQNGMNISFVTTARVDEEGKALLDLLGMPFKSL